MYSFFMLVYLTLFYLDFLYITLIFSNRIKKQKEYSSDEITKIF